MILVPQDIRAGLLANARARHIALADGLREPDPIPVMRFFNPIGIGWNISSIKM